MRAVLARAKHKLQYFDVFDKHDDENDTWLEITSNDLSSALEEIRANMGSEEPNPTPFLACTIDPVYGFRKAHLRPADNNIHEQHFTNFTFLVVDEEYVRSNPRQCILCCDAPDFGEGKARINERERIQTIEEAGG
jgi:hypothetical protein